MPCAHEYRVIHPQLSHPLEIGSAVERTPEAIIAWAKIYILREHDILLDAHGWQVEEVSRETS